MIKAEARRDIMKLREIALSSCMWPYQKVINDKAADIRGDVDSLTKSLIEGGHEDIVASIALEAAADLDAQAIPARILGTLHAMTKKHASLIPAIIRSPSSLGEAVKHNTLPRELVMEAVKHFTRETTTRWAFGLNDTMSYCAGFNHYTLIRECGIKLPEILGGKLDLNFSTVTLERAKAEGGIPTLEILGATLCGRLDRDTAINLLDNWAKPDNSLPFDFVLVADRLGLLYAKDKLRDALERRMFESIAHIPRLTGKTAFVVDLSGSMSGVFVHAAATAMYMREICEDALVFGTAGGGSQHRSKQVDPKYRGFDLVKGVLDLIPTLGGGGIFIAQVLAWLNKEHGLNAENTYRLMFITDEQDCDHDSSSAAKVKPFGVKNYIFNVAYAAGQLVKGAWTEMRGWSPMAIRYVEAIEQEENAEREI